MYIHAIGHFHSENVIDNDLLERLNIGCDDSWTVQRTGIRTRHTVLSLDYICTTRNRDPRAADEASMYSNGETGERAARLALARASLCPSDIGMVIGGGSAPRSSSPAEACLVADRLGISVPCMDVNSACSSWVAQLHLLSLMRQEALPDFVLIVNPENLTRTVDYSDRGNAVLMGDCSTATIVSTRVPSRVRVQQTSIQSDRSGWNKVVIPSRGHLRQDGAAVQYFAVRRTVETIESLRAGTCRDGWFVGHQVNLSALQSICSRSGIAPDRHLYNVDRRGNCGAAGAPSVLSEKFDQFGDGGQVLVAVVGAGLTWAGARVDFSGDCQ